MRKMFMAFLVLFLSNYLFAQNTGFKWAKGIGGSSDDAGTAIAVDAQGNVYTAGAFKGSVDFDPGPGTATLTASGNQDIFLMKTDAAGNFIWAKKIGGPYDEYINAILVDSTGALYMTGFFSGTVDFNPGTTAVFNLSTSGVADNDIFMAKLDTAGNFIWAERIGGTQNDYGYAIAKDRYNHLFIAGSFRGTVDFNPGAGVNNLSAAGNYDVFVSKFDTAGNFIWAKSMGGSGIDYAFALATDTMGNVYATGTFSGTADFDPNAGIYNLVVTGSATDEDVFVSKLDSAGNFVWAKSFGGLNYDEGASIAVDATGVYTTGYFWGTVDFNPGAGVYNLTALSSDDIFISKLDTAGNFKWAKRMGSTGFNQGNCLVLDAASNVYLAGYFNGSTDFDPGSGIYNLTAAGSTDIFISRLDSAGNFNWAKAMGGSGSDSPNKLCIDANNNLYMTGAFYDVADFDPGGSVFNLTAFNTNADIFIEKLGPCVPTSSSQFVTACDTFLLNGVIYNASGVYTQSFTNASGCDSVLTLNLTVKYSNAWFTLVNACNSYTLNGITYTATGSYTQTFTNIAGCDSLVFLDLTINAPSSGTLTQTACDSVAINGQTYTSSGTYTQTLTNVFGCDSTLSINLTIANHSSFALAQTACNSYTLNTQTFTNSGVYTQTFTNAAGCDSLLILQLTIHTVNTTVIQSGPTLTANAVGATYQWVNCPSYSFLSGAINQSYTATANGAYAVIVTQNACTDTSSCYTVSGVGMNEYTKEHSLYIYPNPATTLFTVTCATPLTDAVVNVFNVFGELVSHTDHVSGIQFTQSVVEWPRGMYMLEVCDKEFSRRVKLIVQ